jgi:hypothetical protein
MAPILTKDGVNVAGHKVPLALVGGLGLVGAVVLVLRARSQAAAPAPAPATDYSGGVTGQSDAAALANLQLQLANIGQGINTPPSGSSSSPGGLSIPATFGGNPPMAPPWPVPPILQARPPGVPIWPSRS